MALGTSDKPRIPIIGWRINNMNAYIPRQPINDRPRQPLVCHNQPFQPRLNRNLQINNNYYYIPRDQWLHMSQEQQQNHMNARQPNQCPQEPCQNAGNANPQSPSSSISSTDAKLKYGRQYAPAQMNRVTLNPTNTSEAYTNIFGPPINVSDGMGTFVNNRSDEPVQLRLLKTVRPKESYISDLESLEISQITFGANGTK